MNESGNKYIIKRVEREDIKKLQSFFIQIYGEDTIFQDKRFLEWFLGGIYPSTNQYLNSFIALNGESKVISHLGGLISDFKLNDKIVSCLWAVNAYTLPEYRGSGLGGSLVKLLINTCDVFGVIGFTNKTAHFYQSQNVHLFHFQRFHRYIFNRDERTFEVVESVGQDQQKAKELLKVNSVNVRSFPAIGEDQIKTIPVDEIENYHIGFEHKEKAVTIRDINYLKWRFFKNPYIEYKFFAYTHNKSIQAYIVTRRERLIPTDYFILRIIDMYGSESNINQILSKIILLAQEENSLLIDFSSFGSRYHDILIANGFVCLHEEDTNIFPLLTTPIESRPNNEYLGLISPKYNHEIHNLTEDDVFFTRADSDRDRLVKISQITH